MTGALAHQDEASGPLTDLTETVTSAVDVIRSLETCIIAASTDSAVRMGDLARLIEAVNQLSRAADGIETRAVAAFARRDEVLDPQNVIDDPRQVVRAKGFVHDDADLEVSHLVGISEGSAATRVHRAAALVARFPHTLAAVTAGDVELWQAHQIVEECSLLDDDEAGVVDEWIAPRLKGINPARIRAVARYAICRTNPEKLRKRASRSRRDRTLEVIPSHEPGLAQVYALIPSEKAAAIWEAACALGKQYQELDPALTLDQARADAFVDLVLADVEVRAAVTLGMPIVTSAVSAVGDAHERGAEEGQAAESQDSRGMDDEPPTDLDPTDLDPTAWEPFERDPTDWEPIERELCGPDPGYDGPGTAPDRIPDWMLAPNEPSELTMPIGGCGPLAGAFTSGVTVPKVGYIPADVIARLLERLDLSIARALIDATDGTLVETVTDAYRPNRRMKDFVAVRDGQCRMYGCTRAAAHCDLDHAVPHECGGPTAPCNLAILCRHHHRAKQARHWIYVFDPDTGKATWLNRRTGSIRTTHPKTALAAHAAHVIDKADKAAEAAGAQHPAGASEPTATDPDPTPAYPQFYQGIGPLPF